MDILKSYTGFNINNIENLTDIENNQHYRIL